MGFIRRICWSLALIGPFQGAFAATLSERNAEFRRCPSGQAWAILDAENNRKAEAAIFNNILAAVPSDGRRDLACKDLALRALGRIGSKTSGPLVTAYLNHSNVNLRGTSAFALGLIGDSVALPVLRRQFLAEQNSVVLGTVAKAIGRLGGDAELAFFADFFDRETNPAKLSGVLQGLGFLFLKESAAWTMPLTLMDRVIQESLSAAPLTARHAGFAAARFRGKLSEGQQEKLLQALAVASDSEAKAFLIKAVSKVKTPAATVGLCSAFSTRPDTLATRTEVLRALTVSPAHGCVQEVLAQGLADGSSGVRVSALTLAGGLTGAADPAIGALVRNIFLSDPSYWVREEAAKSVATLDGAFALAQLPGLIGSNNDDLRHLGLLMMPATVVSADLLQSALNLRRDLSIKLVMDTVNLVSAKTDEDLSHLPLGLEHLQLDLQAQLNRGDVAITSGVAELAGGRNWRTFESPLRSAYGVLAGSDALEGKMAILNALGLIGGEATRDFLFVALGDHERLVALAAADAIKKLYNEDVSDRVPPVGDIGATTPSIGEINLVLSQQYVVETTRGSFDMKLNSLAPLSAYNFAKLASQGFYTNILIHRVVPHFVAQAGDPRGDGYGGPGYLIRDEVSLDSHLRGTVGMATAGKDTGGSQFFVNHGGNYHLDGVYTNFATVSRGMEVVDLLEIGDIIHSIKVK
jgi:cyclophilin family peptidyl-prolyl cis-trans isomerase/HEAT repeat protein